MTAEELYQAETGEKAMYRKASFSFHALRYVKWLEKRLDTIRQRTAEECAESCLSAVDKDPTAQQGCMFYGLIKAAEICREIGRKGE